MQLYPEIRRPVIEATGIDPYQRFKTHARNARVRGLEFKFTFPEWWEYWKLKFNERGTHKGQSVMCRTGDAGGYEPGNVRIDTVEANAQERTEIIFKRDWHEAWQESSVTGLDWLPRKHVYGYKPYRMDGEVEPEEEYEE